jgi:hypothetical protein
MTSLPEPYNVCISVEPVRCNKVKHYVKNSGLNNLRLFIAKLLHVVVVFMIMMIMTMLVNIINIITTTILPTIMCDTCFICCIYISQTVVLDCYEEGKT